MSIHFTRFVDKIFLKVFGLSYGIRRRQYLADMLHLVENDLLIRLDDYSGSFYIDKRSDILLRILRDGHYESALARICAEHYDGTGDFVDVGANVGFYSVLAGRRAEGSKVLSIEANPFMVERLKKSIHHNGLDDTISIHECAAGSEDGEVKLSFRPGMDEYGTITEMAHPGMRGLEYKMLSVKCTTLDSLIETQSARPSFIKIDVEGAEPLVLRGALKTIEKFRPKILMEYSPFIYNKNNIDIDTVLASVKDIGYTLIDANGDSDYRKIEKFGDLLALPNS